MTPERFNDLERAVRIYCEGRHLQARALCRGLFDHAEVVGALDWFGYFTPAEREQIASYLTE